MTMEAVKFQASRHYFAVCEWSRHRGITAPTLSMLPKTGRVVEGVCAAFLYRTDSRVGFIENLITNKAADSKMASAAADACIKALEEDARSKGMAFLISATFIPGVASRAERLGFKVMPQNYVMVAKRL